jgi:tetratricopeptide (TPR) repeat protein
LSRIFLNCLPVRFVPNLLCMKKLLSLLVAGTVAATALGQSDSSSYYYNKGLSEKNARRYREAERSFAKAVQFDSKKLDNHLELASAMMEQRRYAEAKGVYHTAEAIDPNNSTVIENLATLSYNMRKYEDAIRYAQKKQQLKIGKDNNLIIARSYYALENYGETIKYCELAYKEDATIAETPYLAGRAFMDMHNYKRAAGCFEQALALDSNNAQWMYEAGLVNYAVPDDKRALYWMEKAGAKGLKKTNEYMENLATAYLNAGQFEKGIGILQEILVRKPEDQEVLYSIAEAYYKIKKYDDAISYWDKALAVDKKNANALYMIGMSYQKKGEVEKGRQLCDRAIQMDPSLAKLKEEKKMPGGL